MLSDIEEGVLCGNYEKETAEMLKKAFANSKHAYDVEKVVAELENRRHIDRSCGDVDYSIYESEAIEIVRKGGGAE